MVLVDGGGLLHPQRFGSACHLGVTSGYPTVGVAKNVLAVDGIDKPRASLQPGEALPLVTDSGEVLGAALVTGTRFVCFVYSLQRMCTRFFDGRRGCSALDCAATAPWGALPLATASVEVLGAALVTANAVHATCPWEV